MEKRRSFSVVSGSGELPGEFDKLAIDECSEFYKKQTIHDKVGELSERLSVPIWIADNIPKTKHMEDPESCDVQNVNRNWIHPIENAITDINAAAPGLHLYLVRQECDCKVYIYGIKEKKAYTIRNVRSNNKAYIFLADDGFVEKQTVSVHELLHALGFGHEHQRPGVSKCINTTGGQSVPELRHDYEEETDSCGITRFDPFSVMLYQEDYYLERKENSDPVWKLKVKGELNRELSELDKVGLNLIFKPCKHDSYNPKISEVTGLYYCGRNVMSRHNHPAKSTTDGNQCGPTIWANCPACRTLKTRKFEEILNKGKWQGWSGLVYCNRKFGVQEPGHDGTCGPNIRVPCQECRNILDPMHENTFTPS